MINNNNNLKMYNLYFLSATLSARKFLVRHRQPFQSEVDKRWRYCADNCVEIGLNEQDEAVTLRWPKSSLSIETWQWLVLKPQLDTIYWIRTDNSWRKKFKYDQTF